MPFDPKISLDDPKARPAEGMKRLAKVARTGAITGCSTENGVLKVDRLTAAISVDADSTVLDLYGRLPADRISDLIPEIDDNIDFTKAFTHLRIGIPCKDRIGLLHVLLVAGSNLGLSEMVEATSTHDYFQHRRMSRRHVESDASDRTFAKVIEAQADLPMAQFWGGGMTE